MTRLLALGLVRPAKRGRAKEQAGIFFVKKKSKPGERPKQRLILDARRVNQRFRTPPGVELCSSEGLSRLEVEVPEDFETEAESFEDFLSEVSVAVGSGDVKDCFHRLSLDDEYSTYFGVGEGFAWEFGLTGSLCEGDILGENDEVDLLWTGLPMGHTWSLFFCQHIVTRNVEQGMDNVHESSLLRDRGPPGVFVAERVSAATELLVVRGPARVRHEAVVSSSLVLHRASGAQPRAAVANVRAAHVRYRANTPPWSTC